MCWTKEKPAWNLSRNWLSHTNRLEKTERLISEGRLAVYCQKLKKDNLAELLIDEGMADRALSANKSSAQMKFVAAA